MSRDIGREMPSMKKGLFISIFLYVLCFSATIASASGMNLQVKSDRRGEITINAQTGNESSEYIFAVITDKSGSEKSFTVSDFKTKAYSVGQTMSDSKGEFELKLRLTANYRSGEYKCVVITTSGVRGDSLFYYYSPYDVKDALGQLAEYTLEQTNGFIETYEKNEVILGTQASLYKTEGFDKDLFARIMINSRPGGGYTDVEIFNKCFYQAEHMVELNKQNNKNEIDKYILDNRSALDIDDRYITASEQARMIACERIKGIESAKVLSNTILNTLSFSEFVYAQYWNDYILLLQKYSDIIILDNASAEKLKKLSIDDVCQKMYGDRNSFNSPSDVLVSYKAAIDKLYKDKSGDTSNNTSSGGSGTSSSGGITPFVPGRVDTDITPDRFSDLDGYDWAKKAIYSLSDSGVVSGYEDGTFRPYANITREEFIKMIVCSYQMTVTGDISAFKDVEDGAWYCKYIELGVGNGIIYGISDSEFGVGMPITRQDLAVIAYRAMKLDDEENTDGTFGDMNSVSDYAKKAVVRLAEMNILAGDENGNFRPEDNATRAEAARILFLIK